MTPDREAEEAFCHFSPSFSPRCIYTSSPFLLPSDQQVCPQPHRTFSLALFSPSVYLSGHLSRSVRLTESLLLPVLLSSLDSKRARSSVLLFLVFVLFLSFFLPSRTSSLFLLPMALFCPSCHNMLLVRQEISMQFHCRTCPYIFNIKEKLTRKMLLTPKKADEPLNEEENMNLGAKAPGKENDENPLIFPLVLFIPSLSRSLRLSFSLSLLYSLFPLRVPPSLVRSFHS